MENIISYLKWRGDLSFAERPFCEVDNLVLAELAYLDFSGIVPGESEAGSITLQEAAAQFAERGRKSISLVQLPKEFLSAAAETRRFGQVRLSRHADVLDEETQVEFSAVTMELGDGTAYVAFRGTSDLLVGWQEDFSMSFQLMPAQTAAAAYLASVIGADDAAGEAEGEAAGTAEQAAAVGAPVLSYWVGGHSKGGNLAVYAAMMCPEELQQRIIGIYSNDGPGFCEDIIDMERYQGIRERICRIVPEFSIIGALFENEEPTKIVASSAEGLNQHNAFSWAVEGDHFVARPARAEACRLLNQTVDHWVKSADLEQRRAFTRDLFHSLGEGGATRVSELSGGGVDELEMALVAFAKSERRTWIVVGKFVKSVVETFGSIDYNELFREKKTMQGAGLFLIGVILARFPAFCAQLLGLGVGVVCVCFLGQKLMASAFSETLSEKAKKMRMVKLMALMCGVVYLVAQKTLRIRFSSLMLGGFFLFHSYRWFKRSTERGSDPKVQSVNLVLGLISFLLGVAPILMTGLVTARYAGMAGAALLCYGAGKIVRAMYENGSRNSEEESGADPEAGR